jgi:hypothetical protein
MIKWLLGKSGVVFKRRRATDRQQFGQQKIAKAIAWIAPEILENRCLLSSIWFVAPSGSDNNAGNISNPFRTIQAAANVAQPGDHVEIRAGVYDETVTPARSGTAADPIVYEAYNGESVTITGANPLANWTLDSGNIYESTLPTNLGEGNNQLFVNGQVVNEARYPASTDLSNPNLLHATSVSLSGHSATIYDSALDQSAGYWDGAIIHIAPGQAWTAQTGDVTSSSPGQITFSYELTDSYEYPAKGDGFYLTGTINALTSPGQFYASPSGKVYLWTPAGDNPNNDDVEAKQRADAFNLNGVSDITVQDIDIVGATISTNGSSTSDVMNHLNVTYPSQFLIVPKGWQMPDNSGVMLNGADDLLENSVIADSPGDGVYVTGYGSRVTNDIIHDVDTSASDSAAIRVLASDVEVDHNTIYNTGRDGIKHSGQKEQILYNTLYNIGIQTTEAGAIYCVQTDGGGTVIAYNKISDMHSGGYGQTALFLDNYSNNYIVHDNIVSNVDIALKLNFTSQDNDVYNNTLDGSQETVFANYLGNWDGSKFTDNIFLSSARLGSGATSSGNVSTMGIPGTGAANVSSGATGTVGTGTSAGGVAPPSGGTTPPVNTPPATTPPVTTPPVTTPPVTTPPVTATPPVTTTPTGTPPATTPPDTTPPVTTTPTPVVSTPSVIYGPAVPASYVAPVSSPAPADALAALVGDVHSDQAAVSSAIADRKATLDQLQVTLKTDKAAYLAAERQFSAMHREATKALSNGSTQTELTGMEAQLAALSQQVKADELALQQHLKTDFSGIAAARTVLSKAMDKMRAARRSVK